MAAPHHKSGTSACLEKLLANLVPQDHQPHQAPSQVESPWQSLTSAIYLLYEIAEAIEPAEGECEDLLKPQLQEIFDQQWAYCNERLHACEAQLPTTLRQLKAMCTHPGKGI